MMTDENFVSTEAIHIHTNKMRGVTIGTIEGLLVTDIVATETKEMIDSHVEELEEDMATNAAVMTEEDAVMMIASCVNTIRAEMIGGMNRVRT